MKFRKLLFTFLWIFGLFFAEATYESPFIREKELIQKFEILLDQLLLYTSK